MSSTNKTPNFNLTQFLGSDVPSWLSDYNGDMSKIDAGMTANQTAANTAQAAASAADSKADTAIANAAAVQAVIDTPNTGLADRVSDVEGDINTIQSLIGNGTPTTTDKTIIGAINELHDDISGGGSVTIHAEDVTYDNTSSGMTADDVQEAIDELKTEIGNIPSVLSKRYICISDSYGTKTDGRSSYVDTLKSLLGVTGSAFYDLSENSLGFVNEGEGGNTALELLQASSASITNHNTITDIIITVGLNDSKNMTQVNALPAAVTAFMTYVASEYPNAKVHYGFIGNNSSNAGRTQEEVTSLWRAIASLYDTFNSTSADVMQGVEYVMHDARNLLSTDWVHPSTKGSTELGKFIYKWLTTGTCKYKTYVSLVANNNLTYAKIDGDFTEFIVRNFGTTSGTTTANPQPLITYNNDTFPIRGSKGEKRFGTVNMTINNEDHWRPCYIEDGTLYVYATVGTQYTGIGLATITGNTLDF